MSTTTTTSTSDALAGIETTEVHGGRLVAMALRAAGVETIFTLSGGHVMGIYDGCLDEGIDVIDVRHEQAAVHAADAWARLHPGKVGVAVLTAGPGVTDGVTGVANAWRANSPIVVFGGQGPFRNAGRGSLQEMDHVSLMRPITKFSGACGDTQRLAEYVELAVRTALSGVPGPAFLEVPMDVLHAPVNLTSAKVPTFRDYRVSSTASVDRVAAAAELLSGAQRPVVMAGTAVKWSCAQDALTAFLDATNIPCYVNGMARGAVPPDHACLLSLTRKEALATADVVVLAGAPLDFRLKFGRAINPQAKIIQLEADEVLVGQNRPVDVSLVGNLGANLGALAYQLAADGTTPDAAAHLAALRATETQLDEARRAEFTSDEVPIDPLRLCAEINEVITDDMIIIGDGGDIVAQASKVIDVPANGTWMDPGPLGTLGVGLPFALAAQKAFGDRRVLIIYGDGSFGLNGFEYDTAVRFGLPVVGVVGNDAAWGQMLRPQASLYGDERVVATELAYTRYDKVVEALGGHGEHVTEPDDIAPALRRAFDSGLPALVNVEIRQDRGAMKGSTYV